MKNGVAIWHYPHRNLIENIEHFARCGYDSVSVHGNHMYAAIIDPLLAGKLARTIQETKVVLTVHSALPSDHTREAVSEFNKRIRAFGDWQREYGLISILSFDVLNKIRDNVTEYIQYAIDNVPSCAIAVEDFGLTPWEKTQLEPFRGCERFGYLVDVGHMALRIYGNNSSGLTLFTNSPLECARSSSPGYEDYLRAFKSKDFPIFEIHLHQNDGTEDIHQFLEDGAVDMPAIARVLKEIEFGGIVTVECAPGYRFECKYPESDRKIQESFDLWQSLLNLNQ